MSTSARWSAMMRKKVTNWCRVQGTIIRENLWQWLRLLSGLDQSFVFWDNSVSPVPPLTVHCFSPQFTQIGTLLQSQFISKEGIFGSSGIDNYYTCMGLLSDCRSYSKRRQPLHKDSCSSWSIKYVVIFITYYVTDNITCARIVAPLAGEATSSPTGKTWREFALAWDKIPTFPENPKWGTSPSLSCIIINVNLFKLDIYLWP